MGRLLAVVVLGSMTIAQLSFAEVNLKQGSDTQPASLDNPSHVRTALPPAPSGKTTVIGGSIRDVDPVRDQIALKVFGGKTMKILFDARTSFYRNGTKTPLRDLRPEDHASVETVLDGTSIFAVSIHVLSRLSQGELQGEVVNYDPGNGNLTMIPSLSGEPILLRVPPGTPVVRSGQAATSPAGSGSSNFAKGTLISIQFASGEKGRGVVKHVDVLATPGSTFVFRGNIVFLDLHTKLLVVVDPRDDKSYKISFDPALFPASRDLRMGANVTVTADYDGTRYNVTAMKVN